MEEVLLNRIATSRISVFFFKIVAHLLVYSFRRCLRPRDIKLKQNFNKMILFAHVSVLA